MELEKQVHIVDDIRSELTSRTNTRLKVRANMGRSKIIECEGTLMQTHPALFILEVDRKRGRTARQSYQYVDVLTGMVELYDPKSGEPLFILETEEKEDGIFGVGLDGEDDEE
ncbi:Veg family protein [Slackia heliotrinireducens]|uniref:Uncharacterized conserved protein n=1 Tax=Slackia heliotrinireducens (strain ATCC 29202 / DSM 20476 / NCTC 11029 / RHS 1) TaxID=471855 RepID=C7N4H1_SLAHD|nr:Veg family protein [Slackia heliotrinireducens]ACV21806.1 uncharacterized conserved protein [Slackia heliotrinireducens DSM 20476]VEG99509.1 Uncharacterized protein conserved in bacteria [Slackia heliotrinireducens]